MKLADARTMKAIDEAALKVYRLTVFQLMENAGRGVAEAVKRELKACPGKAPKVAIVAGKGSNGGDGFVAARHLENSGIKTTVFSLAKTGELKGASEANAATWRKMGGQTVSIRSVRDLKKCYPALSRSCLIVDGIFGTGLSSPVRGLYAEVIESINALDKKVLAIDIPSGIDASTGAVLGHAVKADLTVTMAMPKIGLYAYPGRSYAGKIEIADIGAPLKLIEDEKIRWNLVSDSDMRRILKPREADSHKGSHGHLLVIAGSAGFTGAACMTAEAAMRSGAGLCTVALPQSLQRIIEEKTTEVMSLGLAETGEGTIGPSSYPAIKAAMEGKSAIVIGPGLRPSKGLSRIIGDIVRDSKRPVLIDADGLNSLAGDVSCLKRAKAKLVLTPHPGEMARLLGVSAQAVQSGRMGAAERLSEMTGAVVVLKGAATVIASPDKKIFVNPTGNPGLASAGTGDVLSGVAGGLLAQGYGTLDAAVAAVYLHGLSADDAKKEGGEAGMMATDLLSFIRRRLNSFTAPGA